MSDAGGASDGPADPHAPITIEYDASKADDEKYLKAYWSQVDVALTASADNPTALVADVMAHMDTAVADRTSTFGKLYFENYLWVLVTTLLQRDYDDPTWVQPVMDLFGRVLEVCVAMIADGTDSEKTLRPIQRLLKPNHFFYRKHGRLNTDAKGNRKSDKDKDKNETELADLSDAQKAAAEAAQAVRDHEQALYTTFHTPGSDPAVCINAEDDDEDTSVYYCQVVSKFAATGGYEVLVARIKDAVDAGAKDKQDGSDGDGDGDGGSETPTLGAEKLLELTELIELTKTVLSSELLWSLSGTLHELALAYMRAQDEASLRGVSLGDLYDTLNSIARMEKHAGRADLYGALQDYKLELSLVFMQLPYIRSVIHGIDAIVHITKIASGTKPENSAFRKRENPVPSSSGTSSSSGAGTSGSRKRSRANSDGDVPSTSGGTQIDGVTYFPASYGQAVTVTVEDGDAPAGPMTHEEWEAAMAAEAVALVAEAEEAEAARQAGQQAGQQGDQTPDLSVVGHSVGTSPAAPASPASGSDQGDGDGGAQDGKQAEDAGDAEEDGEDGEEEAASGRYFTKAKVLEWMDDKEILDMVLHLEHHEAVKRGGSLIEFLARERGLEDATLERIWESALNVHESLQIKVFEVVVTLLPLITLEQMDAMYDRISALPIEALNNQVLTFVTDFTKEALDVCRRKKVADPKLYGLDKLWEILLSPDLDPLLMRESLEHLQALLAKRAKHRETFLGRCIDNLAEGRIVATSLKLLGDILRACPAAQLNATVVSLDENYEVVKCIANDIPVCVAAAVADGGHEAVGTALGQRLDSLEYLLTHSDLILTPEQTQVVWDSVVSAGHLDRACRWFHALPMRVINDPYKTKNVRYVRKYRAISKDVVEWLLTERLVQVPAEQYTPDAIKLFKRAFIVVNARRHKLRPVGPVKDGFFRVRSFDGLEGMEQLWRLALESIDPAVANPALLLLRAVYFNTSRRVAHAESVAELTAATDRCVGILEQLVEANTNEVAVARCLYMLGELARAEAYSLKRAGAAGPSGDTAIAPTQLVYRNVTRAPTKICSPFCVADVVAASDAFFQAPEGTSADTGAAAPTPVVWRLLASTYFSRIFELLARAPANRRSVWLLLSQIPASPKMLAEVGLLKKTEATDGGAEAAPWDALAFTKVYAPSHPMYVYYCLYVVQTIQGLMEDRAWTTSFVQAGGLGWLVELFSSDHLLKREAEDFVFGKRTASLLAQLINQIYTSDLLPVAELMAAARLDAQFIHGIIDQIQELAKPQTQTIESVRLDLGPDANTTLLLDDLGDEESPLDTADDAAALAFFDDDPTADKDKGKDKDGDGKPKPKPKKIKAVADRVANCIYYAHANTVRFELSGTSHYQVAAYAVDYNTHRRAQTLTAWLGDDRLMGVKEAGEEVHPKGAFLTGDAFHKGQWVVWDVHGEGALNITIEHTPNAPNWVLCAVLFGPSPKGDSVPLVPPEVPYYPEITEIDSSSQGRWHGRYGLWGGVLFGKKDTTVPVWPQWRDQTDFEVVSVDRGKCQGYGWVYALTNDPRGMQMAPETSDDIEVWSDSDGEDDVVERTEDKPLTKRNPPSGVGTAAQAAAAEQATSAAAAGADKENDPRVAAETAAAARAAGIDIDQGPSELAMDAETEANTLANASSSVGASAATANAAEAAAEAGDGDGGGDGDGDGDGAGTEAAETKKPTVSASASTSRALLEMMVATISNEPALLGALTSYAGLNEWLLECVVHSPNVEMRRAMVSSMGALYALEGDASEALRAQLRTCLLGFLEEAEGARDRVPSFREYFSLVSTLLKTSTLGQAVYDPVEMLDRVLAGLASAPITEEAFVDADDPSVDTLLAGRLQLLACVLADHREVCGARMRETGFAGELFDTYLFGVPEHKGGAPLPKCKSVVTRAAAFRVMSMLTEMAPEEGTRLLGVLGGVMGSIALPGDEDWEVDVDAADVKKDSDSVVQRYTGLKNQCCTCYMNATLQQVFIIRQLREAILAVPLASETEEERKNNVMFQLQLLYAYMQSGTNSWVDTIGFCNAVKLNGAPIDVRRQEDANEFFNSLVDQLEPYIVGTPYQQMFNQTFGGRFTHQIISEDCPHISESREDFLTMTVKVQGKRNLEEGLLSFVDADILDGNNKYMCQTCNKKVVARKRCCVEHLPDTLALHLSRFEFSFETFTNVKVQDHYEFPHTLNMKAYTREGLAEAEGTPVDPEHVRPDDYYEYELVGVLIHSGSASSGHYYSYIRERDTEDGSEPQWYEFNDRRVTPFNRSSIPEKCFGGSYKAGTRVGSSRNKPYSAYMLFYERRNSYPNRVYSQLTTHETLAAEGQDGGSALVSGAGAAAAAAAESGNNAILEKVWRDFVVAQQRRAFLSTPTLEYAWQLVSQEFARTGGHDPRPSADNVWCCDAFRRPTLEELGSPGPIKTVRFAARLLFDVMIHCKIPDTALMVSRVHLLGQMVADHVPAAIWLLSCFTKKQEHSNKWWLDTAMMGVNKTLVRDAVAELVVGIIRTLSPYTGTLPERPDESSVDRPAGAGADGADPEDNPHLSAAGEDMSDPNSGTTAGDISKMTPAELAAANAAAIAAAMGEDPMPGLESDGQAAAAVLARQTTEDGESRPVIDFVNVLIVLLTASAYKPVTRTAQLMYVLRKFAETGKDACQYLVEVNAIPDLLALFDTHRPPFTSKMPANQVDLVRLVTMLARSCDNPCHRRYEGAPGVPPPSGIPMPSSSIVQLFERRFLLSFKYPEYIECMTEMCRHYCYANRVLSTKVIDTTFSGATSHACDAETRARFLRVAEMMLAIQDPDHYWRLEQVMKKLCHLLKTHVRIFKTRDVLLRWVLRQAQTIPDIRTWCVTSKSFRNALAKSAIKVHIQANVYEPFLTTFAEIAHLFALQADKGGDGADGGGEGGASDADNSNEAAAEAAAAADDPANDVGGVGAGVVGPLAIVPVSDVMDVE